MNEITLSRIVGLGVINDFFIRSANITTIDLVN